MINRVANHFQTKERPSKYMIQINDRKEKIFEYLRSYMEECFYKSCQNIQTEIEYNAAEIWHAHRCKLLELLKNVDTIQKEQKKGDLQYLVFNFLRSSIYSNQLELYLDALDSGFYLDVHETSVHYKLDFLIKFFLNDLELIHKIAEEEFVRLQSYELFEVKERYADFYSALICKILESQKNLIMDVVLESGIGITNNFQILYGEYMGNAVTLYKKET